MKTIITATALVTLSLLGAVPAQAEEVETQIRVTIGDLDLAKPSARNILALRIKRAASAACESGYETLDANIRRAQSACEKAFTSKAIAAVQSRTGQQLAAR